MDEYRDIINLSHHQSKKRKHMPIADRAAQFSPFAALTGYDAAIDETARLTDRKIELDESSMEVLSHKLNQIENSSKDEAVSITFFVPDSKKAGGKYVTKTGTVRELDNIEKLIIMSDNTIIRFDDVLDISGNWLTD